MTDISSSGQSNLKRYLFASLLSVIFLSLSLSVLFYKQISSTNRSGCIPSPKQKLKVPDDKVIVPCPDGYVEK